VKEHRSPHKSGGSQRPRTSSDRPERIGRPPPRRERAGARESKPPLRLQPTTLWDYPSQNYGTGRQGDEKYPGVTPSYVIWNLLQRYTKEGELVVDSFAGSGTTLDVAADTGRKARGFDLAPTRPQIERADARALPMESESADFVFIDPPYSTHIDYSDDPRCIGKLDAATPAYYEAMDAVFGEIARILKPGRHMALYVSDSYVHSGQGKGFWPIGFELLSLLRRRFEPVDIIAVTRHNKTLEMGNYRMAAERENFFLRGFNYLFIMRKAEASAARPKKKGGGKPKPWFKYRKPKG
jgi:DNA modification methylase